MIVDGTKLKMKRGDDDSIYLFLSDGSFTGSTVYFSLKENACDLTDILHIESTEFIKKVVDNDGCIIRLAHLDTIELECGTYYYDIFVDWGDGTGTTPVGPYKFILNPGGSHDDV